MPYWFDGNNLTGQSAAAARRDRGTRKSFLAFLSALAAERGARFVVFFDGDDPDRSRPPRGVHVRYSAPLSTDEAILRRAEGERYPAEIVVVTNDLELSARCRGAGLKTLDWRGFTEKVERGPGRPARTAPKEEPIDIDDWRRYFGLSPKDVECDE